MIGVTRLDSIDIMAPFEIPIYVNKATERKKEIIKTNFSIVYKTENCREKIARSLVNFFAKKKTN